MTLMVALLSKPGLISISLADHSNTWWPSILMAVGVSPFFNDNSGNK